MYTFISHVANVLVMVLKIIKKFISFMIPRYCNVLLFLTATPNTRQLYLKSSPVWPVQELTMIPALWLPEPQLPVRRRPLLHKLCTAIRSIGREIFSYLGDSFQSHTACQLLWQINVHSQHHYILPVLGQRGSFQLWYHMRWIPL